MSRAQAQDEHDSAKYMSLKQVAAHFCVDESSVRLSRGEFSRLRRSVILGKNGKKGRVLIMREDVERLDREIEQAAKAPNTFDEQGEGGDRLADQQSSKRKKQTTRR